jgi:hypothetical protein
MNISLYIKENQCGGVEKQQDERKVASGRTFDEAIVK